MDIETEEGRQEALERMVLIREFEKRVKEIYEAGVITGSAHLYIGEEAVAVGACAALDDNDYILSTHRGHGHAIAKRLDPKAIMAELYGKRDGCCGGKGGSMHVANVDKGMFGANALVGSNTSLTAGAALSSQLTGDERVSLSFNGDGAYASGQLHEGLNLAAIWDLPAVYIIENNLYNAFTPLQKVVNVQDLSKIADAYDIPGVSIDGQDLLTVHDTVSDAVDRARSGNGPTVIEAKTYRFRGHHEGDRDHRGGYRSEEELEEWQKRDPIDIFVEQLIEAGELTEDGFEAIRSDVQATIEDSIEFAEDSPLPDTDAAYENVFRNPVPEVQMFRDQLRADGGYQG